MTPRLLTRLGALVGAFLLLLYIVYFFVANPLVHMFTKPEVFGVDLGACPAAENSLTVTTAAQDDFLFLAFGVPSGSPLPPDITGTIKVIRDEREIASFPFDRETLLPEHYHQQAVPHPGVAFFMVRASFQASPEVRTDAFAHPPCTVTVSFAKAPPPGLHLWLQWIVSH